MERCEVCGATLNGKDELGLHTQTRHPNAGTAVTGNKGGDKMREERAEQQASEKPLT